MSQMRLGSGAVGWKFKPWLCMGVTAKLRVPPHKGSSCATRILTRLGRPLP